VLSSVEYLLSEVVVGRVDGEDPNDVEVFLQRFVEGVYDLDSGVEVASLALLGGGGALYDDGEGELVGVCEDEGGVED